MKVAIMQPYFFPYIGYFSLIKHTDLFILFDPVQFIRHGWIERNRILKPDNDWQYIQVPLMKHNRETLIKDISINNDRDWSTKILAQIEHYKKSAPFYHQTRKLLEETFNTTFSSIVELNQTALNKTLAYLGIEHNIKVFSEMNLTIAPPQAPDEWALNICKELGSVSEYWNPPGGKSFFEPSKYAKNNIKLYFHTQKIIPYQQKKSTFIPGLSIIDVLMFNSIEDINKMLDQYQLA